jgi:ribose 5-phosphate isomerase
LLPFVLYGEPVPYKELITEIASTPGVVAHGLFEGAADVAVVARVGAEAPLVIEKPAAAADK